MTTSVRELAAVNMMLRAIGERPVSNLLGLTGEAATAYEILQKNLIDLQEQGGWYWCREDAWPVTPDVNGEIHLPAGTFEAAPTTTQFAHDPVLRGTRLYDKAHHTYVFHIPFKVNLMVARGADEVPGNFWRYVTYHSTREFHAAVLPEEGLAFPTAHDEDVAYTAVNADHIRDTKANVVPLHRRHNITRGRLR